jgi:thiamine pyrophosphate-dependent acetolactate synthase large subunit-like protein
MSKTTSKSAQPAYVLDRREAVPALIGNHKDFLLVAGLAGTAKDLASLTEDGAHYFGLAGAMGAAVSIGLGLALAQPGKRVLVAAGDGELLMNVGALATVGILNPPNLSILCVDNGHYGETGYQKSHTSLGVDLEQMAIGAGIKSTCTIDKADGIPAGSRMLRESNGSAFVLLRVKPEDPPKFKRNMDIGASRVRFRLNLLGQA